MIKRVTFTVLLLVGTMCSALGQAIGTSYETFVHNSGPLEGYTTYKIFVEFTDPMDRMNGLGSDVSAVPPADFFMDFTDTVFQAHGGFGSSSWLGWENTDAALCELLDCDNTYDSFITMAAEDISVNVGGTTFFDDTLLPDEETFINQFEGVDMSANFVDVGYWTHPGFALLTTTSGAACPPICFAGPELKTLAAQITTKGNFDYCFGVAAVPADGSIQFITQFCGSSVSPCEEGSFQIGAEVVSEAICGDAVGSIQAEVLVDNIPAGYTGTNVTNPGLQYSIYSYDTMADEVIEELPFPDVMGLFSNLPPGAYQVFANSDLGCQAVSEVIILEDYPDFVVSAEITQDNLCFGENIADIMINAGGGSGDYQYTLDYDPPATVWSANALFEDLAPGTYTWGSTDSQGCERSGELEVFAPLEIQITLTATDLLCDEDMSGTIGNVVSGGDLNGAYMFFWEGLCDEPNTGLIPNIQNQTGLAACENYRVTVTDVSGCTAMDSIAVSQPDTLTVMAMGTDASCFGAGDGAIDFTPQGGTFAYDAIEFILNGDTDNPFGDGDDLPPGDYVVQLTDANDCVATTPVTIAEPTEITYDLAVVDVFCFGGDNGSITISNTMGGVGALTASISSIPVDMQDNLSAGVYPISISDETGCEVGEIVTVSQPPTFELESFEQTSPPCFGFEDGSIILNVTGGLPEYTFVIQGGPGDLTYTSPDPEFTGLGGGIYTVDITDANDCPTAQVTIELEQPTEIDTLGVNIIEPTCGGNCEIRVDYTLIGGTPSYTDVWNGDEEVSPEALCVGENTLVVTDINGCVKTFVFDLEEPTPVEAEISASDATCIGIENGTAIVLATGNNVEIIFETPNLDLTQLPAGEYPFTVTDEVGCFLMDTVFIANEVENGLALSMFSSPTSCWNAGDGTATAAVTGGTGEITYLWLDESLQATATAVGLSEDTYRAIITDELGCNLTDVVDVSPTVGCLFIANAVTPNGDGKNDNWIVGGLEFFPESKVEVFNRWGQAIYVSEDGYKVPWNGTYQENKLPVADYYYVITVGPEIEPYTGTVTVKY